MGRDTVLSAAQVLGCFFMCNLAGNVRLDAVLHCVHILSHACEETINMQNKEDLKWADTGIQEFDPLQFAVVVVEA